jgi:plastocyanin
VKFGSFRLRASLLGALSVVAMVALAAPVQAGSVPQDAPRAAAAPTEVSLVAGVNDPKDPNIAVLEFLPEKVKVAKGTTVTWDIAGPEPHSVTFVPPGTDVPPSVETDESLTFPTPATAPYDGSTLVNSGVLPLGETSEVQKFSMSFGKTGSYTYYCVLHPNMVGTVTVTDDTQDSQQKITKTGNQQKAKYLKEGEAAKAKLLEAKPKATKNSDGSTTYTVEMGTSTAHTDVLGFAPTPRKVKSGDQVTFVNNSSAPHTASFGGTLVPTIPTAENVVQAQPGPSPQTLAQDTYLNTGWLPPKTKQGPPLAARSYTYSVPAPGKYTYVCVLHLPSGMAGEIDAT